MNYSVIAKKKDKGVVFLRKIVKGAADDSYGIEVAQLAGVPSAVVKRAREVLAELEKGENPRKAPEKQTNEPENMTIDDYIHSDVINKIKMADVESLTPLEALIFLSEIKKMLG